MFSFPQPGSRRWRASLLASLLIHCAVLYVWLHRTPVFVKPSSVARGQHGLNENVTYFPSAQQVKIVVKKKSPLRFNAKPVLAVETPQPTAVPAGTEYGAVGSTQGTEARPALPVVFPDPAIFPWQVPNGLTGDVIVEVTIDEQGNVVQTKLLQGIGYGIEQKVLSVLQRWHFRPASKDGVTIASQHIVYFHYPS